MYRGLLIKQNEKFTGKQKSLEFSTHPPDTHISLTVTLKEE